MFPFVSFTENKLLPTVIKNGECPTNGIKHNYITSFAQSKDSGDFNGFALYGYFVDDITQNSLTFKSFDSTNTAVSNQTISGYTMASSCSNGIYYVVGTSKIETSYYTKTGGFIGQKYDVTNHELRNQFGVPYEANLNSISQIQGTYIGYSISGNGKSSIGYTNTPVSVTIDNNGALSVKDINVETNLIGSEQATVNLTAEVSGTKGLWSGTFTTSSGTDNIGCAIDLDAGNSGKNVIICSGMIPDGTNERLYSLILVNK